MLVGCICELFVLRCHVVLQVETVIRINLHAVQLLADPILGRSDYFFIDNSKLLDFLDHSLQQQMIKSISALIPAAKVFSYVMQTLFDSLLFETLISPILLAYLPLQYLVVET